MSAPTERRYGAQLKLCHSLRASTTGHGSNWRLEIKESTRGYVPTLRGLRPHCIAMAERGSTKALSLLNVALESSDYGTQRDGAIFGIKEHARGYRRSGVCALIAPPWGRSKDLSKLRGACSQAPINGHRARGPCTKLGDTDAPVVCALIASPWRGGLETKCQQKMSGSPEKISTGTKSGLKSSKSVPNFAWTKSVSRPLSPTDGPTKAFYLLRAIKSGDARGLQLRALRRSTVCVHLGVHSNLPRGYRGIESVVTRLVKESLDGSDAPV